MTKVTLRLIPFMFLLYVVNYLDRVNVSFAALQMNNELGFTPAQYGTGAGIFFIGYFIFEVPSNLIMEKTGARIWMARIMISWGLISAAMMFVHTTWSFYAMRFLLGVAEAGFFPGMILYLTYWFPAAERAKAVAWFMTATSVAGIIGGPVSGALLEIRGWGLSGWQWLFLLEGLPAVLLGFAVLWFLTDRPEQATWLNPEERDWLVERMRQENAQRPHQQHSFAGAMMSPRVWLVCLLYFALVVGFYGIGLWLPEIIKHAYSADDFTIGLLSAIPNLIAVIGMVVIGGHSDRTGERRWHVMLSALSGALCLSLYSVAPGFLLKFALLSLGLLGLRSSLGPFWALATSFLSGTAAAGSIAFINSLGNLGGYVGPYAMGKLRERSGGFEAGLLFLAASCTVAAIVAFSIRTPEKKDSPSVG